MESLVRRANIWRGKRVFLTGHTGFKGGWLALWLALKGATVRGYSLDPPTSATFFADAGVAKTLDDQRGDIRDLPMLEKAIIDFEPHVVFHLAAQPLVRRSYQHPIETFETNVMGTAKLLDCLRRTSSVRAVVSVTTDKCYENKEWLWAYRESDPLGGYDPYSSSKACAELATASFRQSFFPADQFHLHRCAVATARAGNVIGGGDWSTDRLLPDLIRGFITHEPARLRHPRAIRPWQHVLDPLHGYMLLAEYLITCDGVYETAFNFGPPEEGAKPVDWLAKRMAELWGDDARWDLDDEPRVHEAMQLKLDASRARSVLNWRPRLPIEAALCWLVDWHKAREQGADMQAFTLSQISAFESLGEP